MSPRLENVLSGSIANHSILSFEGGELHSGSGNSPANIIHEDFLDI